MSPRADRYRITVTTPQGDETFGYTSRSLANREYVQKRKTLRIGTIELRMMPDNELLRSDKVPL